MRLNTRFGGALWAAGLAVAYPTDKPYINGTINATPVVSSTVITTVTMHATVTDHVTDHVTIVDRITAAVCMTQAPSLASSGPLLGSSFSQGYGMHH